MVNIGNPMLRFKPYGLSKRMITFEGSTKLPLRFMDLTEKKGTKQVLNETSRQIIPHYNSIPNIILNSKNIPSKIIQELKYLSTPPVSPEAEDCCGSGCEDNCIFVIYYNEYKHWKQKRHEFLEFLLKEENQNVINEREYDSMINYMGLDAIDQKITNNVNTVTWPKRLANNEWESPPLVKNGKKDLLTNEDIVEKDIENHVPLDILQFDRLEQKLKEKRLKREHQVLA
ncbi:hypothetical protein HANVADRAFT_6468 [Hanseniaspora valbyensis NRRL Y-1626]|uniref:Oxidoreductase-like domain-containing protein n=1 Tax=Hanseniaspora valbyensis NRRL Y-1626 TaxID=766949 RepID=A0A1B7TEM7_9ASCO|nr:hypothetical protein HANVADRAFT_6468 [Hanseniaspora valbyensis NRRL Y-1626]